MNYKMYIAVSVAVTIGALLSVTEASPSILAVGPNLFRLDAEETVLVMMFGHPHQIQAEVYLQDYPNRAKTYSRKTVSLRKDQPVTVPMKVMSTEFSDLKAVEEDQKRYLYLVVEPKDKKLKLKSESVLLVQPSSGYVFIQTDKPIYSPRQSVHIRIFPVDQSLKVAQIPIRLAILNPQDVTVERTDFDVKNKYNVHTYQIVDNPTMGNWTIRAYYGKDYESFTSVQFEVREYILPHFEVTVHTNRYILPRTEALKGYVEAKYLHGKPVNGHAKLYISLELDGKITSLGNVRRKELKKGLMEYDVDIAGLIQPAKLGGFPDGGRLILKAEVTEGATYIRETKEDRTCLFVRSPYRISLADSSRYFKPSLSYEVRVKTTVLGAGPAKNLEVEIELREKRKNVGLRTRSQKIHLDENGRGKAEFGLHVDVDQLEVTVTTKDDKFPENKEVLVVTAYQSPSNSYLDVRSDSDVATVGLPLNLRLLVPKNADKISVFNILVTSRGRIVYTKMLHQHAGLVNTDTVTITQDMVPSIRIVGYYIVEKPGQKPEIVSDSLWVDVMDKCASEVEITADQPVYLPDTQGLVKLRGEPGTLVCLSMVDAAVFLLNDRHLLTRKKMFSVLDSFDLGCGPGGGRDSSDVFMTSGLSVASTTGLATKVRDDQQCEAVKIRKRREAESKKDKKDIHGKTCCGEGIKVLNGSMCYDMATSLENATRKCCKRFFYCCRLAAKCRAGGCMDKKGRSAVGRIMGDFEVAIVENYDDLTPRNNFKESTMIEKYTIGPSGEKNVPMTIPSSITKWMLQGVTLSPTAGLCVANPHNFTVFKEFFIDLRLPVKAVRGEQLEVKVTVYNFQRVAASVVVYLFGVKGMCSEALPGQKSAPRRLRIDANDAAAISFPIMPLEAQVYTIEVVAYSSFGSDLVQKKLRVVPEGKRVTVSTSRTLDPQGILKGKEPPPRRRRNVHDKTVTEVIDVEVPEGIIRGTEECKASIIGSVVGHSVQTSIDGVENMLSVPRGCGEQTMIRMAPTVYAVAYLSQTSPHLKHVEETGHKRIQEGYARELTFRKPDGSFTVWATRPSSTWLTAFVLKVFCQAKEFADIDPKVVSSGLAWLESKQLPDGRFKEVYRVHHQEMIGGVKEDVTLTAFVLITLRECFAGKQGIAPGEANAVSFLEKQLEAVDNIYTKAIVAYALSLTSSEKRQRANERLRQSAVYVKEKSVRYWPANGENSALAVEATSYALLAQLEFGDYKYSHAIVNWLTKKRSSKGAFKSTQDTVVGLQAITKYSIDTFQEEFKMECDLTSEADVKFSRKVKMTKDNALVQQTVKNIPVGGKLIVAAKGSGVGQLQLDVSYNVKREKDELCRFELIVDCADIKFVPNDDRENCDVCGECDEDEEEGDYDYDDVGIIPIGRSGSKSKDHVAISRRRSRVGRQAARIGARKRPGAKEPLMGGASKAAVCISISVSSLTGSDTGMSIIDVGLFTGFSPIKADLDLLRTNKQIDSYEVNDGRVVLYLPKIPKKDPYAEPLTLKFRARQDDRVGNIQPASVKVYYYYEPEEVSCTQFYRPEDQSQVYEKLCIGDKCKCAEGNCPKCYTEEQKLALKRHDLLKIACEEAEYVYEVKITEVNDEVKATGPLQRQIQVDILRVIKPGADRAAFKGESINFWLTQSCGSCPAVEEGKIYLIMGTDGPVVDGKRKYQLDESAFVMEFYNRNDRTLPMNFRRLGHQMFLFARTLATGCPT